MDIQTYICDSTFPNTIQDILREAGYHVEPLPEVHAHTDRIHGAFSFRIIKGFDSLRVVGMEDDGRFGFHMVVDPGDDSSLKEVPTELYDEIEQIMLRNGADLGRVEEL
jgi:hypothetical protein